MPGIIHVNNENYNEEDQKKKTTPRKQGSQAGSNKTTPTRPPLGEVENESPKRILPNGYGASGTGNESEQEAGSSRKGADISAGSRNQSVHQEITVAKSREIYKPTGKAAVARLTYQFARLPDLYQVQVKVYEKPSEAPEANIRSQRLRHNALTSFLKNVGLDRIAAVNLNGRDKNATGWDRVINYVIIPLIGVWTREMIENRLGDLEWDSTVYKKAKRVDKSNGTTDAPVYCRIEKLSEAKILSLSSGGGSDEYRKSIDILFATYASRESESKGPSYRASRDHCVELAPSSLNSANFREDMKTTKTVLRCQPKFEYIRDKLVLHFDFNLGQHMEEGTLLTDLLDDYFGGHALHTGFGKDTESQKRIRQLLCGVDVKLTYDPPEARFGGWIGIKAVDGSPETQQRNTAKINDIRNVADIGVRIERNGRQYTSLTKYFNECESQRRCIMRSTKADVAYRCWQQR
jgi:hypothetical protein